MRSERSGMSLDDRERGAISMLNTGYTVAEVSFTYGLSREHVERLLGVAPRGVQRADPVPSVGWASKRRRRLALVPDGPLDVCAARRETLRQALHG